MSREVRRMCVALVVLVVCSIACGSSAARPTVRVTSALTPVPATPTAWIAPTLALEPTAPFVPTVVPDTTVVQSAQEPTIESAATLIPAAVPTME